MKVASHALLAALAAVTERVSLGPLVACASFHPPGLLAKMAATAEAMPFEVKLPRILRCSLSVSIGKRSAFSPVNPVVASSLPVSPSSKPAAVGQ